MSNIACYSSQEAAELDRLLTTYLSPHPHSYGRYSVIHDETKEAYCLVDNGRRCPKSAGSFVSAYLLSVAKVVSYLFTLFFLPFAAYNSRDSDRYKQKDINVIFVRTEKENNPEKIKKTYQIKDTNLTVVEEELKINFFMFHYYVSICEGGREIGCLKEESGYECVTSIETDGDKLKVKMRMTHLMGLLPWLVHQGEYAVVLNR